MVVNPVHLDIILTAWPRFFFTKNDEKNLFRITYIIYNNQLNTFFLFILFRIIVSASGRTAT